jgi:serine kinase of HPr protein (carbohydrate metabolism regulator)
MQTSAEAPLHLHASAVALGESGVLIRGPSGSGKSSLALALVEAFQRRGDFARLVGDDRLAARASNGRVVLSPHRAIAGLAEWRGIGLVEQDYEASVVLALIVELTLAEAGRTLARMPASEDFRTQFAGVRGAPLLRLPACQTERSVAAVMAFLHNVSTK